MSAPRSCPTVVLRHFQLRAISAIDHRLPWGRHRSFDPAFLMAPGPTTTLPIPAAVARGTSRYAACAPTVVLRKTVGPDYELAYPRGFAAPP